MQLLRCAVLARMRNITAEEVDDFRKLEWNPNELVELKIMERSQLLGLMAFFDIRTYNDMPVIACSDDELRMAYLTWRGEQSLNIRKYTSRKFDKAKGLMYRTYDELIWWLERM